MQGKIALEEHFAIPETLDDSRGYFPDRVWQGVKSRVLDLHERRLKLMDKNGVEMMLLSLNAPAVQAIPDPEQANEVARKSQRLSRRTGGASGRTVSRPCRAADAGPGHGGRELTALRKSSASSARW